MEKQILRAPCMTKEHFKIRLYSCIICSVQYSYSPHTMENRIYKLYIFGALIPPPLPPLPKCIESVK